MVKWISRHSQEADNRVVICIAVCFGLLKGNCSHFHSGKDQCLAWFTDVKDIDANFLNNPKSTHRFGQPVSIADDLKGQKVALLFICNHIDYHVPLQRSAARPSRLLRGNPDLRKVVAG